MKLTEKETRAAVDAGIAEARKIGRAVTIAVVDGSGYLLNLLRMDGAGFLSPQIAEAKAFSAAAMGRPIADLAQRAKAKPETWNAFAGVGRTQLIPGQGGLPVLAGKEVVGAVGISGGSGEEDEAICKAAVDAIKL